MVFSFVAEGLISPWQHFFSWFEMTAFKARAKMNTERSECITSKKKKKVQLKWKHLKEKICFVLNRKFRVGICVQRSVSSAYYSVQPWIFPVVKLCVWINTKFHFRSFFFFPIRHDCYVNLSHSKDKFKRFKQVIDRIWIRVTRLFVWIS